MGNESIPIQLVVANTFLEEYSSKCNNTVVTVLIHLRGHRQIHAHIFTSCISSFKTEWLLGHETARTPIKLLSFNIPTWLCTKSSTFQQAVFVPLKTMTGRKINYVFKEHNSESVKKLKFVYIFCPFKPYSFLNKHLNYCHILKVFPDYFCINGYKFLFLLGSVSYSLFHKSSIFSLIYLHTA